ncbi:murein DD-endopeptidase MepM/ murein hydrolase activator NlpD [Pararhizobium capsulatum DSM 1112]|uniref:Murein DD-endopeptidase MepM/ murein hydrolase activator NlpD n=1 Tax=Pararhizobium capsulatum DSM 1112 TaxID=1121113 RepID=A0ABU0BR62_9HYPH|nr:M23 family metallopeptidase [Pararhizobium capsulatum]MDQ0320453.1 murein DD-endopeptidase MepM/ murein hydrolase activator NlpD [Pararhizobium capsulatum DSM 1112]
MSGRTENRVFGKKTEKHILILAKGDKVRHMTFQPWTVAVSMCFASALTVGYLAATSYLVLRDDLIGGTMARQARMQYEYEDRIAALRAQVDRVTSRQLLDQQVVEEKVEKLLQQQLALTSRHGKLGSLLDRAENAGVSTEKGEAITPTANAYEKRADAAGSRGLRAIERLMGISKSDSLPPIQAALGYAPATENEPTSDRADRLFSRVTLSLKDIEHAQRSRLQTLTEQTADTADEIAAIVGRTGVHIDDKPLEEAADTAPAEEGSAIGGPFVEPESSEDFNASLVALDGALGRLEQMRSQVKKLPFSNPSPASDITSRFGNRVDPFLGRLALHAGIDFRASLGTRIVATAPGTVITAGHSGGYGNMVEIDHGNGVTTRFAHLSSSLVNVGDHVEAGQVIAKTGNTGRSTGPHLHYEVRLNGEAVDPMRFLTAGMKIEKLVN